MGPRMARLGSAQVTLSLKQYSFHSRLAFLSRAMLMLGHGSLYLAGSCIAGLLFSLYSFIQLCFVCFHYFLFSSEMLYFRWEKWIMKPKLKWMIHNCLQCTFCMRLVSLREIEMRYEKIRRNTLNKLSEATSYCCGFFVCLFVHLKNLEIPKKMSSCNIHEWECGYL